jgi:hypothetical protein
VIHIAGGIILAYILIAHWDVVLVVLWYALQVALALALVGATIAFIGYLVG